MKKQKQPSPVLTGIIMCMLMLWGLSSSIQSIYDSVSVINRIDEIKNVEVNALTMFNDAGADDSNKEAYNADIPQIFDSRKEIELPVLMYHSLTGEQGKESEYVVSSRRFEEDMRFLSCNGFTSVFPSDIVKYIRDGTKMPSKPILITFDDGYLNNMTYALPILQKYNMKAVISVIGSSAVTASNDAYRIKENGSLTLGEIALLSGSGLIEFGNHSYDMHEIRESRKGADIASGESAGDYKAALATDAEKNQRLLEKATGTKPLLYAWPYGARPADSLGDKVLQKIGIPITCCSYQHTSVITKKDPDSLLGLGRYLRTPDFDMNTLL